MRAYLTILAVMLLATNSTMLRADTSERVLSEMIDAGFTALERETIGQYYHDWNRNHQDRDYRHRDDHDRDYRYREDYDSDDHRHHGKHKKDKAGKSGLPPGLAKRDRLPPGLEKQLQRNGQLPPGLQKRALPEDLLYRLPPPRDGYERVVVDDDVLLVEAATGVIVDILVDILQN